MDQRKRICFIGLGNMGGPMAINLCKAGYTVSVFDVHEASAQRLAANGARVGSSVSDAAAGAEAIITMLPETRHVESTYRGDNGVLSWVPPGTLLLDCSTIAPLASRDLAAAAKERGCELLDAPVSGGVMGATLGTLTFMVGGNVEALDRARPVLMSMGKQIFHMGDAGSGLVAKLCNNMALGAIMAATCEALAMGAAHGLDPVELSKMMATSTARSWALEACNPLPGVVPDAPSSHAFAGGFGSDLMLKDLHLALQAAQSVDASTDFGELARALFAKNGLAGHGALDFSSVLRLFNSPLAH